VELVEQDVDLAVVLVHLWDAVHALLVVVLAVVLAVVLVHLPDAVHALHLPALLDADLVAVMHLLALLVLMPVQLDAVPAQHLPALLLDVAPLIPVPLRVLAVVLDVEPVPVT